MSIFSMMGLFLGTGLAAFGILSVLWIWAALVLAKRADEILKNQGRIVDENNNSTC
jgi:hypothetical protein